MAVAGAPEVLSDRGVCVAWDGRRLPGPWLVTRAIDLALERVERHGTVGIAIGNGHHISCLAAYLPRVAERGLVLIIASSGPGVGDRGAVRRHAALRCRRPPSPPDSRPRPRSGTPC